MANGRGAIICLSATLLAACGGTGGGDGPVERAIVATPVPLPTPSPTPTPSPAPVSLVTAEDVADVLIVLGQSNASGFELDPTTTYVADPAIMAFDGGRLTPYAPNQMTGAEPGGPTGRWAAELSYALGYRRASPAGRLVILKFTAPGTPLAFSGDPTPDWNTRSSGELLDRAAAYVAAGMAAIRAAGLQPRIRLLWWQQGEADCAATAGYAESLAALVARWRLPDGAFQLPANAPVAIGRLSTRYAAGPGCTAPIRAAERQIAAADDGGPAVLVDTDDLPLEADRVHFTAAAQIALGERLWAVDAGTYPEPRD